LHTPHKPLELKRCLPISETERIGFEELALPTGQGTRSWIGIRGRLLKFLETSLDRWTPKDVLVI
jgi:hypothetical protein